MISDRLDLEVQSNETEHQTLEVLNEVVEHTQPFLIPGRRERDLCEEGRDKNKREGRGRKERMRGRERD